MAKYIFAEHVPPQYPPLNTPAGLEQTAVAGYYSSVTYDQFHKKYWKQIAQAGRRRGQDLGTLVDRIRAILATGQIPLPRSSSSGA